MTGLLSETAINYQISRPGLAGAHTGTHSTERTSGSIRDSAGSVLKQQLEQLLKKHADAPTETGQQFSGSLRWKHTAEPHPKQRCCRLTFHLLASLLKSYRRYTSFIQQHCTWATQAFNDFSHLLEMMLKAIFLFCWMIQWASVYEDTEVETHQCSEPHSKHCRLKTAWNECLWDCSASFWYSFVVQHSTSFLNHRSGAWAMIWIWT